MALKNGQITYMDLDYRLFAQDILWSLAGKLDLGDRKNVEQACKTAFLCCEIFFPAFGEEVKRLEAAQAEAAKAQAEAAKAQAAKPSPEKLAESVGKLSTEEKKLLMDALLAKPASEPAKEPAKAPNARAKLPSKAQGASNAKAGPKQPAKAKAARKRR